MQFQVKDDNVITLRGAMLADHSALLIEILRGVLRRVPTAVIDGSGLLAWDSEGVQTMTALLEVRPGSVRLTNFPQAMLVDMRETLHHLSVFSRIAG
jgi:hypothetical protein